MKVFSMFSGIGGFELGLREAGIEHEVIGYSEIDKYAIQIYEKNFGKDIKNYGDATKIRGDELPDFDLLTAGFPCQPFSNAGKGLGFEDARGTLFFDICRILADKKPEYLVLENVRNVLAHDNGSTLQKMLGILSDLGYSVESELYNSKNHGVPQNRERIYITGHLGARG